MPFDTLLWERINVIETTGLYKLLSSVDFDSSGLCGLYPHPFKSGWDKRQPSTLSVLLYHSILLAKQIATISTYLLLNYNCSYVLILIFLLCVACIHIPSNLAETKDILRRYEFSYIGFYCILYVPSVATAVTEFPS